METEVGEAAAKCMIEMLESYMEFVDIVVFDYKILDIPDKYKNKMAVFCTRRKAQWMPILEELKEKCQI